MSMCETYLIAPKAKRLGALAVDGLLVFLLWYLFTGPDLAQVNTLLQTLDPAQAGALDVFATAIFKLAAAFLLKAVFCQTAYYSLIPALLGRGRTLGKLLLRLCMADGTTLREISASRLMLREFVARGLLETLLVLPALVSAGMALFSRDGRALHDRIAGTVVIQDTGCMEDGD